jgi:hypothetical protein
VLELAQPVPSKKNPTMQKSINHRMNISWTTGDGMPEQPIYSGRNTAAQFADFINSVSTWLLVPACLAHFGRIGYTLKAQNG